MKNKNFETHYENLYKSELKDLDKNLNNFIKQKETDFFKKYSIKKK